MTDSGREGVKTHACQEPVFISYLGQQMLSRFFLNAVDIEVTISSIIASLCFTFVEPFNDIFLFVKLCIGQRKYKQKFMTQGVKDQLTDRSTK